MECKKYNDNMIAVYNCFKEKEIIKNEFGGTWNKKDNVWLIGLNSDNITKLITRFGAKISPQLNEWMQTRGNTLEIVKKLDSGQISPDKTYNNYFKNCELMEHQLIGATIASVLFDSGYTGGLLSMEMGTGKTLTAMAIINRLTEKHNCNKVLIICPKIAMNVWRDEFYKFENRSYKLRVISGTQKQRLTSINDLIDEPNSNMNIAVINYEYVYAFEDILKCWKPDIIVCDESHKIKSPTSKQTKSITALGKLTNYRLALTGTPLTNNILDYFSQYRFLDCSIFGLNYYAFKNRYVVTGMFGEYLRPNPSTFEEFKKKVSTISFRRTKEQCLSLPDYVDIDVPIEIKHIKKYKELEKDYITWLNENEFISVENALTQTLKLRQLTSGFYYELDGEGRRISTFLDTSKIDACMELIKQIIDEGNKVIVFAEFQAEIEKIKECCDEAGIISDTYYGRTSDKKKTDVVDRFQNGDLQVFIGQIESAGISITLTSASHMIFVSTGYKYGVYDQARSRIHRKGQVNRCTYYHLIANNTIDKKILRALNNKEALAKSIIDDYKKGED